MKNITFQRIHVERAGMVIAASPLASPHPASKEEAPQVSDITFRGESSTSAGSRGGCFRLS